MTLATLSADLLKYMVKSYINNGTTDYSFDVLKEAFSDCTDDNLTKAIRLLSTDGFVSVFEADNIAYCTTLLPNGIRNFQDNTKLKKAYSFLKELRTLLP